MAISYIKHVIRNPLQIVRGFYLFQNKWFFRRTVIDNVIIGCIFTPETNTKK